MTAPIDSPHTGDTTTEAEAGASGVGPVREASQVRGAREESGVSTEAKQAADQGAGSTGSEGKQPDTKQADAPKVYGEDVVKALRDENKTRRETAAKAEADLKAAQLENAKLKGDVEAIRKLEQEQRAAEIDTREKKIAELSPLAAEAERLRGALKAEVDARLAGLPEGQRQFAASLPLDQQLSYVRLHSGGQPGAAGARSVGAAGQTQMPVNIEGMTQEQYLALPETEKIKVRAAAGYTAPSAKMRPF